MTNNPTIDGVSRDLISQAYFELDAGTPSIATLASLRALLEADHVEEALAMVAPAVERQEPVAPFYISIDDWNLLVRGDVEIADVRVSRTKRSKFTEPLFARPTEVAVLQSTTAQLQARIAELESGPSEPVYQVRTHGSDIWEDISGESLEMCQCQPDEYEIRKLYTAPPAPVAVVLPAVFEKAIRDAWFSGCKYGEREHLAGHSAGYQKESGEAYVKRACLDCTAALNGVRK